MRIGFRAPARGRPAGMSEQPPEPQDPVSDEVVEPQDQPAAGGTDDGEPAQGEGAPDSW